MTSLNNQDFCVGSVVAVDTETTGLRVWHQDSPFSVGMCDEEGNTWYCDWQVDPFTRRVTPTPESIEILRSIMEDEAIEKVFHNAKFDIRMLERVGVTTNGVIHDTSIMGRVCDNLELTYQLKHLADVYLGIGNTDEKDLQSAVNSARRKAQSYNRVATKEGRPCVSLGESPKQDYWLPKYYDPENDLCEKYCRLDVVRTMGLYIFYQDMMEKDAYLKAAYERELKIQSIVLVAEKRGMRCRRDQVEVEKVKALDALQYHMGEMLKAIKVKGLRPFDNETSDPQNFNPNSSPQLRRVLYLPKGQGGLGLTTERRTDTGSWSTDKNALRELTSEEFVRDLAAYRAAEQALSLFFDKYLDLLIQDPLSPGEEILRPGLNQCGTGTYRFSCSDPNLQQVSNPKSSRDQGGNYQARAPFGPRRDHYWYACDYAQQELRLFAAIANIPFLLNEIHADRDPNTALANKAWGGKNNPAALKAASFALDLGREAPSNEHVAEMWERYEWNAVAAREFGFSSTRSQMIADDWMSGFNYEIVAAEKSLDRGNTRARGKCVMFAKIYGGGPGSITELIYCTMDEARTFFGDMDRAFPEVPEYMQMMISKARRDGFIINPYDRKVRVDKDFAYKAVNYMIQSTAACQMKESMIGCDEYFLQTGKRAHILMPIHDELLFEVHKDDAHKWLLRGIMEIMSDNGGRVSVPTPVEMKRIRSSWADKEDVEL